MAKVHCAGTFSHVVPGLLSTEGFKDTILKAVSSLPTPDGHVPPDSSDISLPLAWQPRSSVALTQAQSLTIQPRPSH